MANILRLDDTDRRLLRVLQADGRISNAELAERCHLSPSACSDRVRRLRDSGYITGFAALVDPALVERGVLIFVEVLLDRTTPDVFETFAAAARRSPDVLECHMVAGGFDYLIKARVRDLPAWRVFLEEVLVRIPGVRETRTYAVLEEVKSTTQLPI
ncbi:winged helix-turn-helix transcriptional regulator [Phenylobacterium kunshanense]|uniref:ArsR family transcriptional regulator n=1 Tax=Phenylobacterium kunshanense TaxID=1445034 RepID=A0A328BI90_9CAUL|nr:winged helix-turn-helix transcriptional regulator [Phenylobacterium kunshanense]RAK67202.1 ArsR family transcriptional regulator [Phenylobacterium kunshanense]